jgi:F-type H+-transporting ATPase subunit b
MISLDLSFWVVLISVLALMAILNAILYKPIRRMLEEREARMSSIRSDVEKYEKNAEQLLQNFNQKLAEARSTGQGERERLKSEGREQERGLLEANSREAEANKEKQLSDLGAQIDSARKELAAKTDAFALEIAQKLLGRAI